MKARAFSSCILLLVLVPVVSIHRCLFSTFREHPEQLCESVDKIEVDSSTNLTLINTVFSSLFYVTGSITIRESPIIDTDLDFLYQLRLISGSLRIISNPQLEDILEFPFLQKILGELEIRDNANLRNISGFPQLKKVGKLTIADNPMLEEIAGFDRVQDLTEHYIRGNRRMRGIRGFGHSTANLSFEGTTSAGPFVVDVSTIPRGTITTNVSSVVQGLIQDQDRVLPQSTATAPLTGSSGNPGSYANFGPHTPPPAYVNIWGFNAGGSYDNAPDNYCISPPDPAISVGQTYIIYVFNTGIRIYNKAGGLVYGPRVFDKFFSACTAISFTDPWVVFDPLTLRFIVGVMYQGTSWCMGWASESNIMSWTYYTLLLKVGSAWPDFPKMAVNDDSVFVSIHECPSGCTNGRIFAIKKSDLYSGNTHPTVVSQTCYNFAKPVQQIGYLQPNPTWDHTLVQYFLATEGSGSGRYLLISWSNYFGGAALTVSPWVDVGGYIGNSQFGTMNAQQASSTGAANGPSTIMASQDPRIISAFLRSGSIWASSDIGCYPTDAGNLARNCARWFRLDPKQNPPKILEAGLFASKTDNVDFIQNPAIGVDACSNIIIGYSRVNQYIYPGAAVAGITAVNRQQGTQFWNTVLQDGNIIYQMGAAGAQRWGDYSGFDTDPNGVDIWAVMEYSYWSSTGISYSGCPWVNYIAKITYTGCQTTCGDGICQSGETYPSCSDCAPCTTLDGTWMYQAGSCSLPVAGGAECQLACQPGYGGSSDLTVVCQAGKFKWKTI